MPHGGNHFRTKIGASSTSEENVKSIGSGEDWGDRHGLSIGLGLAQFVVPRDRIRHPAEASATNEDRPLSSYGRFVDQGQRILKS
jgi:hypothetical protein